MLTKYKHSQQHRNRYRQKACIHIDISKRRNKLCILLFRYPISQIQKVMFHMLTDCHRIRKCICRRKEQKDDHLRAEPLCQYNKHHNNHKIGTKPHPSTLQSIKSILLIIRTDPRKKVRHQEDNRIKFRSRKPLLPYISHQQRLIPVVIFQVSFHHIAN